MKKLYLLFALLAFGQMAWAQQNQTLTLNDGTNLRDEVPIRGWMDREGLGSQFIIPASELTAMQGGTINQLTFYAETASYSFYDAKYKVYITEVDYTEFEPEVFHSISDIESASYCDWNTMADYYSGGVSISNNMMVITLTAPYHYTGGNLLIGIRLTEKGSNGDNINWYGRNQSTVSSVYPLYLGSNEFYFSAKYLPKVTFGYTPSSSAPTCMWPIVNSATVTNHTATISWIENGEATAWQVCLNDDESNILDASTNSYTFTGLDTLSTYTAKVRSVCGDNDYSPWSNKVTFTTTEACAPPTNLTAIDLTPPHATVTWDSYGESFRLQVSAIGGGSSKDWPSDNTHYYGFEENTISPWTQIDADGDGIMWEINSNTKYYGSHMIPESGHTGYKMVISGGGNGQGLTYWPKNYLVSPRIMLGGSISFWARQYYNHGIEAFKVMVSTTGNTSASDFTAIASYELDDRDWGYYTVDLSAYDGQMGYVAFYDYDHGISDALLLIDDITIVEGSNYIDCATNSYTMDVEPNTEYVMRVRTSCGIDDGFSEWSDFYSFTTTDVVPVYEINSEEDWNAFAYAVDHGYTYSGETVSLNTDLNGITTMVGAKTVDNSYKYFKGTFNGNGHTLDVNYSAEGQWAAPFSSIENATIKNLHVTGNITTTGMRPAGIVSFVSGNSTISNCWSEVAISSSRNSDIDAGGLVARVNNNKTVNITDCLFSGSITYSNSGGYEGGGMVGFTQDDATAKLRNCYFAPSSISFEKSSGLEMYRFVGGKRHHVTITNCYYNDVAASQTKLTPQDGTNASDMDNETLLSNLGNGWENKNDEVVPRMVFYTFSGEGTEDSPYLIATASDWNGLVNNVSLGTTYSDNHFKLTADISVTTMVGINTTDKYFAGTFDGNGNILTVNYDVTIPLVTSTSTAAPFAFVNGATIKNLHIAGSIATEGMRPASVIGFAHGNCTITNCWSEVAISSSRNGDIDAGGFVARVNENKSVTLNGCAFTGSITYSDANGYEGGGMVGYTQSGATATLNDCLFAPSAINITKYNTTGDDWTKHYMFVGGRVRGTCNNCYYNDVAATAVEAGMVPETENKRAHSITTNDQYISLGIQGIATSGTTIGVIGYGTGIQYDGVLYAGSGETVCLLLDYTQPGYDASNYYANETEITLNEFNSYTLHMPNTDVVITANVTTAEWEGTGTDWEHAYQILNKDQLNMLATRVNSGNDYSNKYFKLMGNITYTYTNASNNTNYTPIGNSSSHKFNGHFDGQNYTISGVRDKSGGETDIRVKGLFGYLGSGAEVKNIVLSNTQFYLGCPISGIAGDNEGTVTNCHVTSNVEFRGTLNSSYIMGGIVGINQSTGTVSHCTFAGTLNRNHRDFSNNYYEYGGIVGGNYGTLTDNLVCGATIYQVPIYTTNSNTGYGAITGFHHSGTIARNYYTACTIVTTEWVNESQFYGYYVSIENATGVGSGGLTQTLDLTTNDGAVPGNTRTISGYGDSEETNWAFIASPLTAITSPVSSAVENIFSASEYDLYRLNPVSSKWENWKAGEGNNAAPGFSLENGRGYLYATQEQETVKFIGATTSAYNLNDTKEVTLGDGFNLVGNPFPRAAYINKSYYKLNAEGSVIVAEPVSSATFISPCNGVIIQGTANEVVTFSTTAPGSVGTAPNNGGLSVALTQANTRSNAVMDNAIVSFNEGSQLGKFYFGTQNANIYIPQSGKEYAIAFSKGQGEMPLNFKANENGQYTITIHPEGVDMAYLHLIDNMTGADIDLLQTTSYSFNAKTTDYESRFRLVFACGEANGDNENAPFAFVSNGEIIITGVGDTFNASLQIVDMMGRIIVCKDAVPASLSTNGIAPGVYVLRLINGGDVKTQKIVIR